MEHDPTGPLLWGDKHDSNPEMLMIVASPPGSELTADSTPVSLLMVSMQIDYRIKDLYAYRYHCHDPEKVMETIAYQELSNYTAGVSSMELMGHGRSDFGRHMRERLQRRCDQEVDLGIEITFVCLQEAHPPAESNVAATFQGVVTAEIRKEASIVKAKGRADRILTLTAGSVERAKELDAAVKEYDILSAEAGGAETPEVLGSAGRINELLFGDKAKGIAPASGKVAAEIAGARASRSVAISRAQSKVRSFRNDLVAYESAPALYKMRRYLQLLREKLPRLRKFVFTSDLAPGDLIIEYETRKRTTLDLETAETP